MEFLCLQDIRMAEEVQENIPCFTSGYTYELFDVVVCPDTGGAALVLINDIGWQHIVSSSCECIDTVCVDDWFEDEWFSDRFMLVRKNV